MVERVVAPDSIVCPCGCGDMVRIGEDRSERLDYIPARYQVIVTVRPRYACPKGRTGVAQAKVPAHLLEGSWPTEALLAQIALSKHSEHMPLSRQAVVMARHGVPIDRSVLADWMGRTGALIASVVDHMAKRLMADSTRLYVDETTAPVLDPGRGKTKTGYLWAVLRDDRGWNGTAPPGVVFHYRPGRKGEYAAEILTGFNGTIQVDAYGAYTRLATPERPGGDPLRLAFCWAHGRRKLIKATPRKGSPIVDEALLRIAALYKIEDAIRGSDPDHRLAVRQDLSRQLVDEFFTWLAARAARVSRKSELGEAMAYMLKRQDGFRLFLDDGRVDIDSNPVENAIRSPAMNRRNALFAGHDEGGRNRARFASLIGTCKMTGVEPYAYLRDLFTKLANGHLAQDIEALMPWAYARQGQEAWEPPLVVPDELPATLRSAPSRHRASAKSMGRGRRLHKIPTTASEIENRLNEITFNGSLIKELRSAVYLWELIHHEGLDREACRDARLHMIGAEEEMQQLSASSKLNAESEFLLHLREIGRNAADAWLSENLDKIGVESTWRPDFLFEESLAPAHLEGGARDPRP